MSLPAGSRTSNDRLSPPPYLLQTRWQRMRLPVGIVALALAVGGGAFVLTRGSRKPATPVAAAPTPPAVVEPTAPRVDLNTLPVEPTPSAAPSAEADVIEPATLTPNHPKASPRGTSTSTPAPAPKKKNAGRQDPGF